ncbi:MAG: DUF4332 domain-containing protein [Verrucomicrobium sp.]|nr:DUF4332 domain-containing protein [Verrucomicrobium sp.]
MTESTTTAFPTATPLEGPFAPLLTASGVRSSGELARNQPEKLLRWMEEVNAEQRLVRKLPTLETVRDWINQAQSWSAAA